MKPVSFVVAAFVSAVLVSGPVAAKTFKWSFASDIPTLDIHSQNNALSNGIHAAIYETLVTYNSTTFRPEPLLATSWTGESAPARCGLACGRE